MRERKSWKLVASGKCRRQRGKRQHTEGQAPNRKLGTSSETVTAAASAWETAARLPHIAGRGPLGAPRQAHRQQCPSRGRLDTLTVSVPPHQRAVPCQPKWTWSSTGAQATQAVVLSRTPTQRPTHLPSQIGSQGQGRLQQPHHLAHHGLCDSVTQIREPRGSVIGVRSRGGPPQNPRQEAKGPRPRSGPG